MVLVFAGSLALPGQELVIESLSGHGVLTWTNGTADGACRVEWAPTAQGPWAHSWESLVDIPVTSLLAERAVPMFYRVVSYSPRQPTVTDVTAAMALPLVAGRIREPDFVVLDVRTPAEYGTRHLRTALNVDFRSTAFEDTLTKLDRKKTYFVYCASGSRSRQASEVMRRLQFLNVNNLTEGFGILASLPGAVPYLDP